MHLYLHLCGRVVVHLACLYLALLDGLEYRVDKRSGGLAEGYLAYHERLAVELFYLCPHLQRAPALSLVVFAHVDASARREVGIERKRLAVQIAYGGVAYLVEVVRQNL